MTENLKTRLAPPARSGIYRLDSRAGAPALARLAEAAGWKFFHVDAGEAADKAGFLSAAARSLDFPAWAGHNWDAFEELVNDLRWLPPARGYVVLLDHFSRFAAAEPQGVRICLDILATAVANRDPADPPLLVLVRGAGRPAGRFPSIAVEQRDA